MQTKLTQIDIEKSYKKLLRNYVQIDFDFFIFTICATIICFFGLLINSPSIIIGSMVLSPLLYPVIAVAMSFLRRDWKVFFKSIILLSLGLLLVLVLSFVLSLFVSIDVTGSEIISRVSENVFIYFVIAFTSGFAGMLCFLWPKSLEAITGVAIAIAVLPPLVILGLSMTTNVGIFEKALLTSFINIIGIFIGSFLVLFLGKVGKKMIKKK